MNILVTGSRDYYNEEIIKRVLLKLYETHGKDLMIIHGACRGADLTTEKVCKELQINYTGIPAKWNTLGRAAGPVRNREMADMFPDISGCVAFHEDIINSKGTKDMVKVMLDRNIWTVLYDGVGGKRLFNPKQLELEL